MNYALQAFQKLLYRLYINMYKQKKTNECMSDVVKIFSKKKRCFHTKNNAKENFKPISYKTVKKRGG